MFTETQRFNQWWIQLLFAGINGLFALGAWQRMAEGDAATADGLPPLALMATWLVVAVLTLLFFRTRLLTRVDREGVRIRFAPWQRNGRTIPWSVVKGCRVRRYRPLAVFGGWGLRRSMNGRLQGYTTRGDQALELDLGEGRGVLIGTQRPEELAAVLQALGKWDAPTLG